MKRDHEQFNWLYGELTGPRSHERYQDIAKALGLNGPLTIAQDDQFRAATAETVSMLADAQRRIGLPKVERSHAPNEAQAVFFASILTFRQMVCPHAYSSVLPAIYESRFGVLACVACVPSIPLERVEAGAAADDECDICRAKADWFTPLAAAFGPLTLVGDACETCKARLMEST